MKPRPLLLSPLGKMGIAAAFLAGYLRAQPIDDSVLLRAIAEVESGTSGARPYRKVGAAGERSAWQITPQVWRTYTRAAFERASREVHLPNCVAAAHLAVLKGQIRHYPSLVTVQKLALAWNGGLGAVRTGGTARQRDYAQRVEATYERLVAQR